MKLQISSIFFFVAILSYPVVQVVAQVDSLQTTSSATLWKLRRKNSIVLEGFGTCIIDSLGYERILRNRPKNYLALRGSLFAYKEWQKDYSRHWESDYFLTLSVTKNALRRKNRYVEYGSAITWSHEVLQRLDRNIFTNEDELKIRTLRTIALFGIIGYRWQKINAPFFFKTSLNPALFYQFGGDSSLGLRVIPWAGFMVGYSFKHKKQ